MLSFVSALRVAALVCLTAASLSAHAWKTANVYACVYLPVPPTTKINFKFYPLSLQCMAQQGSEASMEVSKEGISCTSLGPVELKGSGGGCWWKSSDWALSYTAENTPYSGSIQSEWGKSYGIRFKDYSPGTSVNVSPTLGEATSIDWENEGPIYVIFSPTSGGAMLQTTPAPR